jgi:hypothetical protein
MNYEPTQRIDEVEQLMLNAQLRTELEPFFDESIDLVNTQTMTTSTENEFLASMLAWERAPVLPIGQWFQPELKLTRPELLTDQAISSCLTDVIQKLYDARIVLEFTEHLSDRRLYCLIYRDILPSPEKKVDLPKNYLHWHCLDSEDDEDTWLTYYASDEEREGWQEENHRELPSKRDPPFVRRMPRRPPC